MPARNRILTTCTYCSSELSITPYDARRSEHHFCNSDCYVAWQSQKQPVPCSNCGAILMRRPYLIKVHKHHFCNKSCFDAWADTPSRPLSKPTVTVYCANCNAPLERKQWQVASRKRHFCNRTCDGQWRSQNMRGDKAARTSKRIEVACTVCQKIVLRTEAYMQKYPRPFCGIPCLSQWKTENKSGENAPNWQGGAFEFYGPDWNEQRRRARKRDGYKCQRCGKTQKQNKRALDVHHIQPFRSFNYIPGVNDNYIQANQLHNLICLCRTCHGLVERGGASIQPRLPLAL